MAVLFRRLLRRRRNDGGFTVDDYGDKRAVEVKECSVRIGAAVGDNPHDDETRRRAHGRGKKGGEMVFI